GPGGVRAPRTSLHQWPVRTPVPIGLPAGPAACLPRWLNSAADHLRIGRWLSHKAAYKTVLEATPDARRSGCQQVSALATETTRTSPLPVALEAALVGPSRNDPYHRALARRP